MTDDLGLTETMENLCDTIVKKMSRKELEDIAWDYMYNEFRDMRWEDVMLTADYFDISVDSL